MCRNKKTKVQFQPVSEDDEVLEVGPIAEGSSAVRAAKHECREQSGQQTAFHAGAIDGTGVRWRQSLSINGMHAARFSTNWTGGTGQCHDVYQSLFSLARLLEAATRFFLYGAAYQIPMKGQCFCEVRLSKGGRR